MAIAVKENTSYAVEVEVTEGTYVAPSADTSYVQTLSDGAEMVPAKELLERNIFEGSIGKVTPRIGTRSVSGAMPVEMRAHSTEGAAPEYDALMRSALGSRRQAVTKTANDTDSGTPHTASRIYLLDADASVYVAGDIVTVEVTGDHHTSPITAVSNTPGDVYIDLLVADSGAFTDGDVIQAVTTYVTANSGHPSLSISKYLEAAVLEQATGCRVSSMSLEGFETGQLASWNFAFDGLNFDRSVTARPHTPAYDSALPPIILSACVFQDGVSIDVNSVGISLENALGFVTSTCSANGRTAGRATQRTITGTINPYKQDDSVADFTKFDNNTEFSLYVNAYIPGASGARSQVCSIYLPFCLTTELAESDQDGLLQEEVSFMASRGPAGASEEMYISFS